MPAFILHELEDTERSAILLMQSCANGHQVHAHQINQADSMPKTYKEAVTGGRQEV